MDSAGRSPLRLASAGTESERLELILAAADLGDWSWNAASDAVAFSPRASAIFGIPPEQPVTWSWLRELLDASDRERARVAVEEALASHTDYAIEYLVHLPSGGERWVAARGRGTYDEQGQAIGMIGVVQDVTERRLRDEAQRYLLQLSDSIRTLRNPRDVRWHVKSTTGQFFQVSRCTYGEIDASQEYISIDRDYTNGVISVVGTHRLDDFGPPVIRELRAGRTLLIEDIETDVRVDAQARQSFAAIQTRSLLVVPLVKEGRFVAIFGLGHHFPRTWTARDAWLMEEIAERTWFAVEHAKAEAAREASEARFRVLADAAPVLVWMSDNHGQMTWLNKTWLDFVGRGMEQATGNGWLDDVYPADRERCEYTFRSSYDPPRAFTMEYRLRRHDGEYRWVLDNGVPLFRGQAFDGFIGSCVDITERKVAEEERERLLASERAARLEAERLNRTKDEFLSTVSHELRTPLSSIVGWAQLMQMETLSAEELRQGVEVIQRNAKLQAQIIEDLLDMSRIVSGNMRLDVQSVDLLSVIQGAIDSVRPAAESKEIRLITVLDPKGSRVRGDFQRLQQVIWNLLSNAVKFTPKGGRVQVILERVNSHIEIHVSDTGIGLADDFLPHVFERFRQADASTTRRYGGLGIGLAIVKNLVELHGGSVRVKSPGENLGATFTVCLPAEILHAETGRAHPTKAMAHGAIPPVDLAGLKILVVDDEPDARQLIHRVLTNQGAEVTTAASASEALILFRQRRPDVLLSDIGMPGRDGYELIRDIRLLPPSEGRSTPAAALTAFARSEDRQRSMLAGFQAHLAKPFETAELLAIVAMLAGRTS